VTGNPVTYTSLNSKAKPGNYKFVDTNHDGKITSADMTNIGDPNPKFVYGLGANLGYRNFDLSLFFQGSYGNKIFNMLKVNSYSSNNGGLNWSPDLLDSYMPAKYNTSNPNEIPTVTTPARNENTGVIRMDGDLSASDFFVEDGSYLRLKNLQLGYTIPVSLSRKIRIERCRIYIGAKNLLTFTNYSGFDPEVGENTALNNSILEKGFDRGTYPQSKMYMIGINLGF
jgi:hypothetical protein